jgi:ribosomal protein S18 acetylase RimI-like enzyme
MIVLRAATSADAESVARVLIESRRAFLPYAPSPHAPDSVRQWVAESLMSRCRVTVVVSDGHVVAVLAVSEIGPVAWIEQLYVLPCYENRGVGTTLLAFAHRTVKRPVRLFTFQQNTGARRFYERHGYRVVALSDGQDNEEKCPDVLYELSSCDAG